MLKRTFAALLAVAVLLGACTTASESEDGEAATQAASASPPLAVSDASTPTPVPPAPASTATAIPTATPTPDPGPLFTQVELPSSAVSSSESRISHVLAVGGGGFIAGGYEYHHETGRSLPRFWSPNQGGYMIGQELAMPDGADYAVVGHIATNGSSTVLGGSMVEGRSRRPALWRRSDPASEFSVEVFDHEAIAGLDRVWVSSLHASDALVLMTVAYESAVLVDDDGEPVTGRLFYESVDGMVWAPVELPGYDAETWRTLVAVNGDKVFIVGRIGDDDPDAAVRTIFRRDTTGGSWITDTFESDLLDVTIDSAVMQDDEWIAYGKIGAGDQTATMRFTGDDGGVWSAESALVTFDGEARQGVRLYSALVVGDDQMVATAVIDGLQVVLRSADDGRTWTAGLDEILNSDDIDKDEAERRPQFVDWAFDGNELFAARGFATPVSVDEAGVHPMSLADFGSRQNRHAVGIMGVDDEFTIAVVRDDAPTTSLWHSRDGLSWERGFVDQDLTAYAVSSVSGVLMAYGVNAQDQASAVAYAGEPARVNMEGFIAPGEESISLRNVVGGYVDNTIVLATHVTPPGETQPITSIGVLGSGTALTPRVVRIADVGGALPAAVCPGGTTGSAPILLRSFGGSHGGALLWSGLDSPVGLGILERPDEVSMDQCVGTGGNYVASGSRCVGTEPAAEDSESQTECVGAIWVSIDGLTWTDHPDSGQLRDRGVLATTAAVSIDGAALVAGSRIAGEDRPTLWYVDAETITEVPIDDMVSTGNVTVLGLAVASDRLLLLDTSDNVFGASLPAILDAAQADDSRLFASDEPDADASTVVALGVEIAAVRIGDDSSAPSGAAPPAPRPTLEPLNPPQQVAPQGPAPTAAPAPTSPPAAVPVCSPGQLTTTGACVCSGGRLYDDGGQCVQRCRANEDPDGFGGCLSRDGSTVDPGTDSGGGGVIIGSTLTCTITTDANGKTVETCETTG